MLGVRKQLALGAFILGSIVVIVVLIARSWWQNMLWEQQLYGMASYAGSLQASKDHSSGTLRLFQLGEDDTVAFTGEDEGPFEIWSWPSFPELGHPSKVSAQAFIKAYNARMGFLVEKSGQSDSSADLSDLESELSPSHDSSLDR